MRRFAFTLAMLLLPVLFFGLVEGGLRLGGYGESYPLFVPVEGHPDYLYQNRDVARRYFTRIEAVPSGLLDFFPAVKDSGTYRIFVQGGSSGAGYPYYYGGAFSRMLEQRLLQTFPDRTIEVINTSMSAVSSYTLRDLVPEILAQKPDAVLIYAGHNEYYGALGVGSAESVGGFPFLVHAYLRLIELRTVQLLRDGIARAAGLFAGREKGEAPSGTLMQRMVREQAIPYDSPLYRMGLRQFRTNLRGILADYRASGIPVYIGTLASNERDHRPFISGHTANAYVGDWERQMHIARSSLDAEDPAAALDAVEGAMRFDARPAEAYFEKGRILERLGRTAEARAAYLEAKDRDELRFRAPEEMNLIIREEAERYGAVVVETQDALARSARAGIIGSDLMTEHLHPNVEGYFRIADAYYHALQENAAIGEWTEAVPTEQARSEILLTPVDSLVGVYRIQQLMAVWPFQPPGVVKQELLELTASDPVEQIALDLYQKRMNWREANDRLRQYYESVGNYHRALQAALVHIQEYPFVDTPYLAAGNVLLRQHRYNEALTYFQAANEIEESALARRMIGSIYLERGDREVAITHLERAVELDPEGSTALYNLSGAYALAGQKAKARETAERLLEVAPEHQDGQRLLSSLR